MKSIQTEKPTALLVVGAPGSGKTTFAKNFGDSFIAPVVYFEAIKLAAKNKSIAEQQFFSQIDELAKTKQLLVIDVCDQTQIDRSKLQDHLKKLGYVSRYVWVQTDPSIASERLQKKYRITKKSSSELIDKLTKIISSYSPLPIKYSPIVISGRHTFASQSKAVLSQLVAARPTIQQRTDNQLRSIQIKPRIQ